MSILLILGSSRRQGNSELLAEQVIGNLPCSRLYLMEHAIQPIVDKRHSPEGFSPVADDYDDVIARVMAHDTLVFVTPVYWYTMSGLMKNFIDRWSQSLRDSRYAFREVMRQKRAYVVIAGGDQPRIKGLPLIQTFQYAFDYVGLTFGGYVIGEGDRPGDVLQDAAAMSQAAVLRQLLQP
ncbi:MAG: flavodoxin family protein [Mycobacterium leprae]